MLPRTDSNPLATTRRSSLAPASPGLVHPLRVGSLYPSISAFQAAATRHLTQAAHPTGKLGAPLSFVPFEYQSFQTIVCARWKELDCPAGVAAELIEDGRRSWSVRAVETVHSRACRLHGGEPAKETQRPSQVRKVEEGKTLGKTANSPLRVKLFRHTSAGAPLRSPVPKTRVSSPIKLQHSLRKAATDNSSSSGRGSIAKEKGGEALCIGRTFDSLAAFQKAGRAFGESAYPKYGFYFRARRGDRPEVYCRYQNSQHAQTSAGLNCKYGFNAKRRVSDSGDEIYVVTRADPHHNAECLRRSDSDDFVSDAGAETVGEVDVDPVTKLMSSGTSGHGSVRPQERLHDTVEVADFEGGADAADDYTPSDDEDVEQGEANTSSAATRSSVSKRRLETSSAEGNSRQGKRARSSTLSDDEALAICQRYPELGADGEDDLSKPPSESSYAEAALSHTAKPKSYLSGARMSSVVSVV